MFRKATARNKNFKLRFDPENNSDSERCAFIIDEIIDITKIQNENFSYRGGWFHRLTFS